jgi:hypothetical protein
MSKEPSIYKSDYSVMATFPGNGGRGWDIDYLTRAGTMCTVSAPGGTTIYMSLDGKRNNILPLGEMIFFNENGQEVGRVLHKEGQCPIAKMLEAAQKASDYGFVEFKETGKRASLFGLLEAIEYAEKTCAVSIR